MHYFCTIFWALSDKPLSLCYILFWLLILRHNRIEKLQAESKLVLPSLEQLELKMQAFDDEFHADKE
jgi:hypothetical protein